MPAPTPGRPASGALVLVRYSGDLSTKARRDLFAELLGLDDLQELSDRATKRMPPLASGITLLESERDRLATAQAEAATTTERTSQAVTPATAAVRGRTRTRSSSRTKAT